MGEIYVDFLNFVMVDYGYGEGVGFDYEVVEVEEDFFFFIVVVYNDEILDVSCSVLLLSYCLLVFFSENSIQLIVELIIVGQVIYVNGVIKVLFLELMVIQV